VLTKLKVVLATGAFDLLHYGHYRFLEEAKKSGGKNSKLIVIIARDKTIKKRKGKKPILPEDQRRALVEALKPVDQAILGYEEMNVEAVIRKIKPDIIAVGYDQNDMRRTVEEILRKGKSRVKIVQIGRFGSADLNSSSKIKRRVIEEWR
jgi:FAD synthetase